MDDQMRLQAVVVDGYTGPLAKLRESLKATGSVKTGANMRKDWEGVRKEITSATRELNTAFAPALRGIGIASLGIGASVAGMLVGLKDTASMGRNLKFLSDQLGISADKLREIEGIGQHFDIPIGQTESALKGFADNMNQLARNWGAAYNTLRGMNLGWLAEDLKKALAHGGLGEAFDKALDDLKKIPDPVYRRQIAQLLLGSDQWSVVATELSKGLLSQIQKDISPLDPDFEKKSERFVDDLKHIERQLNQMKIEFLGPLLPGVSATLEGLDAAAKAVARDFEMLKHGDWKGLLAPDPFLQKQAQKHQLESDEYRLKGVESDLAAARRRGLQAPIDAYEAERRRLIDEIEKLRKAVEDSNKNTLLQKQSFIGGAGAGMPHVIPAMYSGGMGAGFGGIGGSGRVGPGGVTGNGIAVPDNAGAGLNSSAYLAARRAGMKAEIAGDPGLRNELAGMMLLEGTPLQTMESLANRTDMMNKWRTSRGLKPLSLHQMLFSGFYGPINRGQLPGAIARLKNNPALMKRMNDAINAVMGGSNSVRGFTDQGMPSDPNGAWGLRHDHIYKGRGNLFTDWGGGPGHDYARRFREEQQRAVRDGGPAAASIPVPRTDPRKGAQAIEGHATLHVQLDGLPSSAKTHFAYGGMFREVRLTRTNRQAALADDYVS